MLASSAVQQLTATDSPAVLHNGRLPASHLSRIGANSALWLGRCMLCVQSHHTVSETSTRQHAFHSYLCTTADVASQ